MKKHTEHWNHVGVIAFCKVMNYWEFYKKDNEGYITMLFNIHESKMKGYGRARAYAKKWNRAYELCK